MKIGPLPTDELESALATAIFQPIKNFIGISVYDDRWPAIERSNYQNNLFRRHDEFIQFFFFLYLSEQIILLKRHHTFIVKLRWMAKFCILFGAVKIRELIIIFVVRNRNLINLIISMINFHSHSHPQSRTNYGGIR